MLTLLCCSLALTAPIPTLNAAELKKEQDAAWADLAKFEKDAARALLKFSSLPVETVNYFKANMKPLLIESDTVKKLIADLNNEDEKVWKPAYETFEYFDPRLAVGLQVCFDTSTPGLGRQRLVSVLCDYKANACEGKDVKLRATGDDDAFNFSADNGSWWAEARVSRLAGGKFWSNKKLWTRAERAIILLEHIGTPDAIAILKTMATGHKDASPTFAAKESLKKLKVE